MNIYCCIIIGALLLEFILFNLSRLLDLKNISTRLPNEFKAHYSESEYARSQEYLRENTRFSYLTSSIDLLLILMVNGWKYSEGLDDGQGYREYIQGAKLQ